MVAALASSSAQSKRHSTMERFLGICSCERLCVTPLTERGTELAVRTCIQEVMNINVEQSSSIAVGRHQWPSAGIGSDRRSQ